MKKLMTAVITVVAVTNMMNVTAFAMEKKEDERTVHNVLRSIDNEKHGYVQAVYEAKEDEEVTVIVLPDCDWNVSLIRVLDEETGEEVAKAFNTDTLTFAMTDEDVRIYVNYRHDLRTNWIEVPEGVKISINGQPAEEEMCSALPGDEVRIYASEGVNLTVSTWCATPEELALEKVWDGSVMFIMPDECVSISIVE